MKKLITAVTLVAFAMVSTHTVADASVKKGQKIYLKKLKAPCNIGGATFAQKHTQDEWEAIYEAGKFGDEVKKLCPKIKKFKPKYAPHVYDFVYEYASDSGNVPAC